MPTTTDLFNNRIIDNQTGRTVEATALTNLKLAGWSAWQHPDYTDLTPLTLTQGVETRITFPARELLDFAQFDREPRIGNTFYPLWDFDSDVFMSYEANRFTTYECRLQCSAKASTAATGVACEAVLRIPADIAIQRAAESLNKGTAPQRVSWNLSWYTAENTEGGLELYLQAIGDDIDIYNLSILVKSY